MGQVRFQIGVPKAGSAARSAESEPRTRSLSSLAGSAARAAEAARRTQASTFSGAPTISMRAVGGVVQPPQQVQASNVSTGAVPAQVPTSATEPNTQASAATQAEDSSQSGQLQTAASRIHSLVQSLFGGRTRTP